MSSELDHSDVDSAQRFYNHAYDGADYAAHSETSRHPERHRVFDFVKRFHLQDKRCLEVGCGRGAFQDYVDDWTGVDLSASAQKHIRKRFVVASATDLPFDDGEFDAIWTVNVLEHVPGPEKALAEIRRVVRPGGTVMIRAGWYARRWLAEGYPVRPWSDFGIGGKLIKASIPLRKSVVYRAAKYIPKRIVRRFLMSVSRKPLSLHYGKLTPNYEQYWMSDSDAVSELDPVEILLWFLSRGDVCLSHQTLRQQMFCRTPSLVFQIRK